MRSQHILQLRAVEGGDEPPPPSPLQTGSQACKW